MLKLIGRELSITLFALRAYGPAKIVAMGAVARSQSGREACRGSYIAPSNLFNSISNWLGEECLFAPESIVTRPRPVEPHRSLD
jgi:hypothetical protein